MTYPATIQDSRGGQRQPCLDYARANRVSDG